MRQLSLGKYHRLQRCSSEKGTFAILAIDHRTSLIRNICGETEERKQIYDAIVRFKQDIVAQLSDVADAVLIDPEYGVAQCVAWGALHRGTGLIISIESSGYKGEQHLRESVLLAGWSVEKCLRLGADGVKLLVYYHPEARNVNQVEGLVTAVAEECRKHETPLFLEPLTYSLKPGQSKERGAERRRVVIETARRLSALGADVLKMEFPLDIEQNPVDDGLWYEACAELSEASAVPWVLLSAAVAYETFIEQVKAACKGGASGIAVGRAVWNEAQTLRAEQRADFLCHVARGRMQALAALCATFGRPWREVFAAPNIEDGWHEHYCERPA